MSPPAPRRPCHRRCAPCTTRSGIPTPHHHRIRRPRAAPPPDLVSSRRAPTGSGLPTSVADLLHQCWIRRSRAPEEEIRAAPAQRQLRRRRAALLRAEGEESSAGAEKAGSDTGADEPTAETRADAPLNGAVIVTVGVSDE